METDFNNVQDQNLIDDSIVNDISAGDSAAGQVGSVVHPGDQVSVPPAPTPPKPPEPPQRVPTAQEILGEDADSTDDDPLPDMSAAQDNDSDDDDTQPSAEADEQAVDDIPQPEIQAAESEATPNDAEETDDEPLIPAPAEIDQPDSDETVEPKQNLADDESSEDEQEPEVDGDDNDMKEDQNTADDEADDASFSAPVLGGGSGDDDELMGVKQQALEELSPLVDHLDLPADQKFDTYMEILRASDDKTLVKPAFEAAKAIEEEDKRAQALLDVVNEVNYLTQDETAPPEA